MPILNKENYYDLAALPFAFEAATDLMHGDFARAILSALIVIGIVYVVHNPENQFTKGFKRLSASPWGAFGLLVFLLAYIASPRIAQDISRSFVSFPARSSDSGSPTHIGCKPITTKCPKGSTVKILDAGPQTSVVVSNTGSHQILVGGPDINPNTGEGALISPSNSFTTDSSAALYCYGVDDSSTISMECSSP